jgi:hypothetical protein
MVRIWSKSTVPDIAGDLCATSPQCGKYCNHETVTAFMIPIRDTLYQSFNVLSAILLLATVVTVIYAVQSDTVHQINFATRHENSDDRVVKAETFADLYLAQKRAQNEIEKLERAFSLGDDEESEEQTEKLDNREDFIEGAPRRDSSHPNTRARIIKQMSRDSGCEQEIGSVRLAVANAINPRMGLTDYDTGNAQNLKYSFFSCLLFTVLSPNASLPPSPQNDVFVEILDGRWQ